MNFEFQKKRDFGAVIGDSLQFFTRNFKSFLLGFLIYIGPFFLIGALGMVYLGRQFMSLMDPVSAADGLFEVVGATFLVIPLIFLASIFMIAFTCAMAQKHQNNAQPPLANEIWPYVRKNLWPATKAILTVFFLIALPYALILIVGVSMNAEIALAVLIFLSLPVVLYFMVPLTIYVILQVLENKPVVESLKRSFFLVRERWWNTFAVYLVLSILASIASYIFILPAYIIFFIQTMGSLQSGQLSPEFGLWLGIIYACGFLGSLFAGMYQVTGIILQYFSLKEQKEGTGLLQRIQHLDTPSNEAFV